MLDIDQIKQDLEQKKTELIFRLKNVDSDIKHETEPVEKDFAEQATQCENDDVLRELSFGLKNELNQVARAIDRIEAGEYQYCANCGEKINENRLAVLPHTTLCINCADKAHH